MNRAVILGCGPAGLAAALAAVSSGFTATIISKSLRPSRLYGCQYLHAPIPGYEDVRSARVRYSLAGTAAQYRKKVYGDDWAGKVSPEDFVGEHDAWDIRETYQRLWEDVIASDKVHVILAGVNNGVVPGIHTLSPDGYPAAVISTIPAPSLCFKGHEFRAHEIRANGSTESGSLGDDSILCDGTKRHNWYRISNVFGYSTTEWPADSGVSDAVPVTKPLSTNCDCFPEFLRVGRYGKWEKGYLVHQVYPEVMQFLAEFR
jgi:hypothetical protein